MQFSQDFTSIALLTARSIIFSSVFDEYKSMHTWWIKVLIPLKIIVKNLIGVLYVMYYLAHRNVLLSMFKDSPVTNSCHSRQSKPCRRAFIKATAYTHTHTHTHTHTEREWHKKIRYFVKCAQTDIQMYEQIKRTIIPVNVQRYQNIALSADDFHLKRPHVC